MALLYLSLLVCLGGFLMVIVGVTRFLIAIFRVEKRREQMRSGGGLIALGLFLAVASTIFQPRMPRNRSQGQFTACKSNLKNIGTALEMYTTDYGGAYPSALTFLTPNYLKTIPQCPAAGEDTYSGTYHLFPAEPPTSATATPGLEQSSVFYRVHCKGTNHFGVNVKADYPAYNGRDGLEEGRR